MTGVVERAAGPRMAIVVKGYPRLSETFIAQEILQLETLGFEFDIWSLRQPTDGAVHMMHRQIRARLFYLPEYLYHEPWRVLRGLASAIFRRRLGKVLALFWKDLRRDFTPNRVRRLGQALVLAREIPETIRHIHVHYLHTPCSVVRYAARMNGLSFSISAHAKDIFTIPAWEKREKMADAVFLVTCTKAGLAQLHRDVAPADIARTSLIYHGLNLARFPTAPEKRLMIDGSDPAAPVTILSVGRAVAKKGYDDLLAALALLPKDLSWRFVHIGGGVLAKALRSQAERLGLADRVSFLGSKPQDVVVAKMREADIFALACKEAPDGDRDGLPNVILEAATQHLAIVSTDFAGVPEFITPEVEGLLVAPANPKALAEALARLIGDPELRARLGQAAGRKLREAFSFESGIEVLAAKLREAERQRVSA